MKVAILYKFRNEPTGGGNQFLNCLKKYLKNKNVLTDNLEKADVLLFNSHHYIDKVLKIKKKYNSKIFIHRIDGPIKLYNNINDKRDNIIYLINKIIADGTIFQSDWSRESNYKMGFEKDRFIITILNTVDKNIFNKKGKIKFSTNRKIKLIATSWSKNINKGFEVYKWLDDNLDFNKYEMSFVGRSPINFKRIKMIQPQTSLRLSKLLKSNDIYITASKNDPCSNSLIEALSCGLPAIVLNSGGHPEIIKNGGELFNQKEEILFLLEKIIRKYNVYSKNIVIPDINEIGIKYLNFMNGIYIKSIKGLHTTKKLSLYNYLKLYLFLMHLRIDSKFSNFIKRK